MKRTRFTDEQIIGILAEHEAGAKCADLCRKHGCQRRCNIRPRGGVKSGHAAVTGAMARALTR